ncbi:MAG TPA: ATP-binding protein, partial [Aggregatilineales bacterium]|nr:ATP-binding protein [Aggregatilineales bacterium]
MIVWLAIGLSIILAAAAIRQWIIRRTLEEQLLLSESERRDINSRLQTAIQLRDSILQSVPDGLLVMDTNYIVRFANPAAEQMLGQNPMGDSLIAAARQEELDKLVRMQIDEDEAPTETHVLLNHRNIYARVTRMKTHEGLMSILMLRDETELQRLTRARRDMVAYISHDLRTPIATISLLADTLAIDLHKQKNAKKMIRNIQQETATLTQLVQEMRDLSLIESGQLPMRLTPTNLAEIVHHSYESLQSLVERKEHHVEINISPDIIVLADPDKLERVVKNILHNAIKYTKNGGEIRVYATRNDDEEVTVAICDNGPGIAEENKLRIFERFF